MPRNDAFLWGSNSSHQLAEGSQEKILAPKKTSAFQDVAQMEAGQYCTFVILEFNQSAVNKTHLLTFHVHNMVTVTWMLIRIELNEMQKKWDCTFYSLCHKVREWMIN